jgi:DNA-binding transcriptional MerR regulator
MTSLTGAAIGAIVSSGMSQALSALELSARSSEPTERLDAWCDAGLIGDKTCRLFAPEDLQRIRLIQFLLRRGFALEAIVQANKEAGIVTSHVDLLASDGQSETYSVEEAAAKIGWGIETVRASSMQRDLPRRAHAWLRMTSRHFGHSSSAKKPAFPKRLYFSSRACTRMRLGAWLKQRCVSFISTSTSR